MNKPTFERFNYSLRPAKNVERKMLCDAFSRLNRIQCITKYSYLGFGSLTFADLAAAHKRLGIKMLHSIENRKEHKDRFEFNKPFSCIEMEWGEANEVLRRFPLSTRRTIVWLDYEGHLTRNILDDIYLVMSNLRSGSMFLLTVLADTHIEGVTGKDLLKRRMEQLESRLGGEHIPAGTQAKDLAKWGLASIYQQVVDSAIQKIINERNQSKQPTKKLKYQQLFNFNYADGTKMATIGGILYNKRDEDRLGKDPWHGLPFMRTGCESYGIQVPVLTWRETALLDQLLSQKRSVSRQAPWLPLEDRQRYQDVYRYSPSFLEVEF